MKIGTICYLIDESKNKILLGKKKYGSAKGIINGFGGKVETTDKSIEDAVIREFFEETSVTIIKPNLSGIIHFHYKDNNRNSCAYIYLCSKWEGEPKESEEMEVGWFDLSSLPIENMWPDDKLWLSTLLEKRNLVVTSYRNNPGDFPHKTVIEVGKDVFEGMHKTKSA